MAKEQTQKNVLTGNEDLDELKRALENAAPNEDEGTLGKTLTNADINAALWTLADELENLQYLREHTHITKTIQVVE